MFFTLEKIDHYLKEIHATVNREVVEIPRFKYHEASFPNDIPFAHCPDFDDHLWNDFLTGQTWGGYDRVAWFRAWVPIPAQWRDKKLGLRFQVGPRDGGGSTAETLLYVNAAPLQGIDVWHEQAWLPPEFTQGTEILVALKAWSGVLQVPERRRFKLAQLVWIDEGAERFYHTTYNLVGAIRTLPENDLRRVRLLQIAEQAFRCIDFLKPRSPEYYHSLAEAAGFLAAALQRLDLPELKPQVTGIGHSHIDMAWLWRLVHSREKASRTFSTVLHLMRQYPEYIYMHSSPQLYQYLKEDYPEIYQQVKRRIAEGRWEVTGGMWVEADTNLTSGESLIRQILLGKRFTREEFGVEMNTLWLPDVFGYSAALPQIIQKSGLKYFLTSKISWSQFNRFPHDTFHWRGLDGTEVLTHFVTTPDGEGSPYYTYNGRFEAADVQGIWENYRQKDLNDELLLLYGWGDGGGGPTAEMLEAAASLHNLPGLPEISLGKAEPYFERLEQRLQGQDVPVWDGELYLEYHRGTYTSQAYNKRANRQSEFLFHNAEWLSALAGILSGRSPYPHASLRRGWKLILVNQFHDILPGSSIHSVYQDCRQDYAAIQQIGQAAITQAVSDLSMRLARPEPALLVFNPVSWERDGLVELPLTEDLAGFTIQTAEGGPAITQAVTTTAGDQPEKRLLIEAQGVPSLGYRAYQLCPVTPKRDSSLVVTPSLLENDFYRINLNERGQIASLWDKCHEREVLAPGARANVLQAFEDKPLNFDAWDIDIYYQEKMREVADLVEAAVEETGPLRGTLRLSWRFGRSLIVQRLSIYRNSPRIDFRTEVDWQEAQVLLKVAFPVDIRATRATYDIQFGNLERPTHWNTSWDYARFEAVGHKWVDLSEGNYGVALLNDCKYGHDVKNNVLRLTLIKSSIDPDPQADKEHHTFTYSLLPHAGDWRVGQVARHAYELNLPLLSQPLPASPHPAAASLPDRYAFASVDAPNVMIETVKAAETGRPEDEGAWIVRVYEYQQCRSNGVRLEFGQPLRRAVACNLIEEDEQEVGWQENSLTFSIQPYEIKTFKVWFSLFSR